MNKTYRNIWNPATGTWCAAAENTKRRGKGAQLAGSVAMALGALGSVDAWAADPAIPGVGGLELCQNSTTGVSYGISGVGTKGAPLPIDCTPGGGKVSFSLNNTANNAGGYGFAPSTARITGYSTGKLELRGTSGISMLNDVLMNGNSITQLKAGQVSADSTDAITGSQLYVVSTAVDKNAAGIAANLQSIGALASGKLGLVQQAGAGQKITVGAGTDGKSVDFTNNVGATRSLTGVTAGLLSASSTDAVNGKQLFTTNQSVSTNTTNISNLSQTTQNLASGKAGLVQQLGAGQKITVGAGTDGTLIDLANNGGGARTLTGVNVGELSVGSTDAVNGSQLFATNRNVANNAAGIDQNRQSIVNLDGRVTTNENSITHLGNTINELSSGTAGLVQQATPGANLTVGAGTNGAAVDFTNQAGDARKLTGIASGDLSAGSTDAVTGAQLNSTNLSVAKNANDIAGLDGRVSTNASSITNLGNTINELSSGTAGLVQQSGPGANLTVGAATDGTTVDFTNKAGSERVLTGIGSGSVSAGSRDAVTGSQLYDTNQAVAGNTSSITTINNTVNELASGTLGLVKQVGPGQTITVGAETDGNSVDLTNQVGATRTLTGVTAANLSASSTDAVNGSQLFTTNEYVSKLDTRVGASETNITNLGNTINELSSGTAGLVQQATPGANLTVGAATDGAAIDFTNRDGSERKLTGIASGDLSAGSTDAVTGAQLNTTNTNVGRNTTNIANLDGRVGSTETQITNIDQSVQNISTGKTGLVQQIGPGAGLTVGATTDGTSVDFTNNAGVTRTLTGLANGNLSTNSSDAVNGAQLFATNENVATNAAGIDKNSQAITGLDGRMTTNETNITNLGNTINELSSGTAGLVQQSAPGANLTVGAATDGAAVDFTNKDGSERKLTGIASGDLSTGSSDAVTGAQLNTTNTNVGRNTDNIANLDSRVGSTETQITNIDQSVQNITSGKTGLVLQTGPGAGLTVGAATDGTSVDFTNNAGVTRTLTGIANGNLAANSSDAVTGSQLFATNQNVTANTAGIDKNSQAITGLDGRVSTTETNITNLGNTINELSSGTAGLVQQSAPGANLTVGAGTDGAAVDFRDNTGGKRTLTGIASGDLSAGSTDAVTGSQLFTTNETVARNVSAIGELDGRVTTNRTDINNLSTVLDGLQTGSTGIVQQASSTSAITVGKSSGGNLIDFSGTGGARRLTGVANGIDDHDAVTMAQLKAYDNVMTGTLSGMVSYDDSSYVSVTLKGQSGTTIANLAAGSVAEGSMEAINGGQLYVLQQQFGDLSKKYAMWQNQGSGNNTPLSWAGTGAASTVVGTGAQASGSNSTAVGHSASATGENSTALGQGSSASGQGSLALGQGAGASGVNSVALGAGSVALRDNSVSVGGPGAERQITNVAAGTAPTDAVNVQQMQSSSDHARRDAYSGVAAAMAVAGLPQSTQQGRTLVAAGGGVYASRSAFALGVSYMSRDSRWVVKGAASSSDNGQFGGAASVGYYF